VENGFSIVTHELRSGMVKAPTDADLARLRQFLRRLEIDAQNAGDDADRCRHEIEMLKEEIAYLETDRSRAYLSQIGIDFGSAASNGRSATSAAPRASWPASKLPEPIPGRKLEISVKNDRTQKNDQHGCDESDRIECDIVRG
jgi:hypothetical protein